MLVEPLVEHKRDCPMSSRSSFPTEVYSTDCRLSQSDSVWEAVAKPMPKLGKSGKRKRQEIDKHPVIKNQWTGQSACALSYREKIKETQPTPVMS